MKKGVSTSNLNRESKRQRTSSTNAQEAVVEPFNTPFSLEPLSIEEITIRSWVSNARARTSGGQTALHLAAREGQLDAIRWLLQNGEPNERNVNVRDYCDRTPLHFATWNGCYNIIEFLVNKSADIDMRDINGQTPIMMALVEGLYEIAAFLQRLKAEEIAIRTWVAHARARTYGTQTALHHAVSEGRLDAIRWLLQNGNPNEKNVNVRDGFGQTSLHCAALGGHCNVIEFLLTLPKSERPDVNATDRSGCTPLHLAAWGGHRNVTEFLFTLPEGERPNIRAFAPRDRLLHNLAEKGDLNIIEFLLTLPEGERPNVNAIDVDGHTPLYYAARSGHRNVIEFLLTLPEGERPNVNIDYEHALLHREMIEEEFIEEEFIPRTPIAAAFEQGHHEIVALLQRHGAMLPAYLRVPEIALDAPIATVNNAQSIHTTSNHESVSDSANKLLARHKNEAIDAAQKALIDWVLSLTDDDVKTQAAKSAIATFGNSDYIDPRSGVTFKQAFGLVWLGVNDKNALTEQTLTDDDINIRRQTLIEHLYRMQRGYNLNAAGIDNGLADKPICTPGAFSTLINTLAGGHQDVTFIYITPETINLKAEALLKEILANLTHETKAEHVKEAKGEILPVKLLELIKTAIEEKLNDEFLGCKGLPSGYAELVQAFCTNLEFHSLTIELAKTLDELRLTQEKNNMDIEGLTEKAISTQEAKTLTFSSVVASASTSSTLPNILRSDEKTRKRARS